MLNPIKTINPSKTSNFFKNMSKPFKYGSIFYFIGIIGYNSFYSYSNSKEYLNKYREIKLTSDESKNIKSEFDAVEYGCSNNFGPRFFMSIVWPISLANNIIPSIVLKLNQKSNN